MQDKQTEKNQEKEDNKDAAVRPDAETLNTTDPQEHMEGPVSSLMHETGKAFESEKAERDAKEKKDSGKE
jgi:hypothetical protein